MLVFFGHIKYFGFLQKKGKKLLIFFFNFSTYRVGTCYTSSECASKSGKAAGNCAAG